MDQGCDISITKEADLPQSESVSNANYMDFVKRIKKKLSKNMNKEKTPINHYIVATDIRLYSHATKSTYK